MTVSNSLNVYDIFKHLKLHNETFWSSCHQNIKDTGMKFLKFKLKLLHNFFKKVICFFLETSQAHTLYNSGELISFRLYRKIYLCLTSKILK